MALFPISSRRTVDVIATRLDMSQGVEPDVAVRAAGMPTPATRLAAPTAPPIAFTNTAPRSGPIGRFQKTRFIMPLPILTIDESSGLQKDDTSLELPAPLLTAIGSLAPMEKTVSAPGVPTFAANVTDVSFTNASGAPLVGVNSNLSTTNQTPIYLYSSSANNNIVFGRVGIDPDGAGGQPYQANPNGANVFAIYLDTGGSDVNATSAKIWVVQFQSMFEPIFSNPDDIVLLTGVLKALPTTGSATTTWRSW
jgi:hypothetical protein